MVFRRSHRRVRWLDRRGTRPARARTRCFAPHRVARSRLFWLAITASDQRDWRRCGVAADGCGMMLKVRQARTARRHGCPVDWAPQLRCWRSLRMVRRWQAPVCSLELAAMRHILFWGPESCRCHALARSAFSDAIGADSCPVGKSLAADPGAMRCAAENPSRAAAEPVEGAAPAPQCHSCKLAKVSEQPEQRCAPL